MIKTIYIAFVLISLPYFTLETQGMPAIAIETKVFIDVKQDKICIKSTTIVCARDDNPKLNNKTAEFDPATVSTYKPISYRCPDSNNDTVEIVKKNTVGAFVKVVGYFKYSAVFHIKVLVARPGKDYVVAYRGVPKIGSDDDDYTTLTGARNQLYEMKTKICDSSDYSFRSRYDEILAGNRRALENASPEHYLQSLHPTQR